jgi:hypothetical protein
VQTEAIEACKTITHIVTGKRANKPSQMLEFVYSSEVLSH